MKNILLTMKVKTFMDSPDSWKYIKYEKDCGHTYSYIEHPINDEIIDHDDLICELNDWLSENEDLPECDNDCSVCS